MVVFVLDDPGRKACKGIGVLLKIFVQIFNSDIRFSEDIFPDVGNTEAAFVKGPFITFFL